MLVELINRISHIFQDLIRKLFELGVATVESFEVFQPLIKHFKRRAESVFSFAQSGLSFQDLIIQIVEILAPFRPIDIYTPFKSFNKTFVEFEWLIHVHFYANVFDFFFFVIFPLIKILGKLPDLFQTFLKVISEAIVLVPIAEYVIFVGPTMNKSNDWNQQ